MLSVTIICVGKLGEKHWRDACGEYQKRLQAFCKPTVIEVPEHKLNGSPSAAQIADGIEKEGVRILPALKNGYTFAMCIEGEQMPSRKLAKKISSLPLQGISSLNFIIGGSYGLSNTVKQKADFLRKLQVQVEHFRVKV